MQPKKSKPSSEPKPEPKPVVNQNAEPSVTNPKSEPVITAEIKPQTPKAQKGKSSTLDYKYSSYIYEHVTKNIFSDKSVSDR